MLRSSSFLLSKHPAIPKFVSLIKNDPQQKYVIICERKEDLKGVRAQIYQECITQNVISEGDVLGGLSMYTLDQCARNFAAILSYNHKNENIVRLPFLDILEQETLIAVLLQHFGYRGHDILPLSRQIVTLIDVAWPEGYDLVHFLQEVFPGFKDRSAIKQMSHTHLKKVMATYQAGSLLLSKFCRFQSFVSQYMNLEFANLVYDYKEVGKKNIKLPLRILNAPILWIEAPAYQEAEEKSEHNAKRFGNFFSHFVDDFRSQLKKAHVLINDSKLDFVEASFYIPVSQNKETEAKVTVFQDVSFTEYFSRYDQNYLKSLSKSQLPLIADLDFKAYAVTTQDASGIYTLPLNTVTTDSLNPTQQLIHDAHDICHQHRDMLMEISKNYDLPFVPLSPIELYEAYAKLKDVWLGGPPALMNCDRALSLIASEDPPEECIVFGKPHTPKSASLFVKAFNQIFYALQAKGVAIDVSASEISYRAFWQFVFREFSSVTFCLPQPKDLQELEFYYDTSKLGDQIITTPSALFDKETPTTSLLHWLRKTSGYDPQWQERCHIPQKNGLPKISVTAFERYVQCPFQFYLSLHLDIGEMTAVDATVGSALEQGTLAHKCAEIVLTRISLVPPHDHIAFLEEIENWLLSSVSIVTLNKVTEYSLTVSSTLEEIQTALREEERIDDLEFACNQEVVRRALISLVRFEKRRRRTYDVLYSRNEVGLQFVFEDNLVLTGKADRIDTTSVGIEILDYKVSTPADENTTLTLFPQDVKAQKARLSVQGALYSSAWVRELQKEYAEDDDIEEKDVKLSSFSLCYLKDVNEDAQNLLSFKFPSQRKEQEEFFATIYQTYKIYAERLQSGHFAPSPLAQQTCQYCPFHLHCPVGRSLEEQKS